jgi:hypothetical protein
MRRTDGYARDAQTLEIDGEAHPLCGVLPVSRTMPAPLVIGYVEVTTTGGPFDSVSGHPRRSPGASSSSPISLTNADVLARGRVWQSGSERGLGQRMGGLRAESVQ